jgi:hypothetical protein
VKIRPEDIPFDAGDDATPPLRTAPLPGELGDPDRSALDDRGPAGGHVNGARRPSESKPRVRFRRGGELDATPITYLVESMIPAGMFTALGGKDSRGKTLFGMEEIKCILTGEKLFGEFAVQQGAVYAMFLDDPEFLVRERLERLGILNHPNLHIATERDVDMADPRAMLRDLIALIKAAEPRPIFIFVDALYLFIPKGGQADQGNSAGAMGPVVEAFNSVSRETGAALQLVTHDNKAGSDIAGSYAIRAGVKGILRLLLPPDIEKRVAKGDEEAAETAERILQLNKLKTGRRASWRLRLDGPGRWHFHGGASEYRKATLLERVVEYLEDHGDQPVERIQRGLKARQSEVRAACGTLFLADKIARSEWPRADGKPGRGTLVYGPLPPAAPSAHVNGTDSFVGGKNGVLGTDRARSCGTDRLGEKEETKQEATKHPDLSVPFFFAGASEPLREAKAICPDIPGNGAKNPSVPQPPDPDPEWLDE